jgi:hypothetical protein
VGARRIKQTIAAAALAVACLAATGCGGSGSSHATAAKAGDPACPRSWVAGWQKLANRVKAPVYCPTWMPQPLNGKIAAPYAPQAYINRDRSYLVSFISAESIGTDSYEVHVNFRGYPGRTTIPRCQDTVVVGRKVERPTIPCFADPHGTKHFGKVAATVYTANQGVDTWHILYAWRHDGSLYTISEHVTNPYTYAEVVKNLDHMMRTLSLVEPNAT